MNYLQNFKNFGLRESEIVVNEAKVELDTMDFEMKSFQKYLNAHNIKAKVINPSGPGGGWPIVRYIGSRKDLKDMILNRFNPGKSGDPMPEIDNDQWIEGLNSEEKREDSEVKYSAAATDWAENKGGSAISLWGDENQLANLGKMIVNKTHQIKSVSASMSPDDERAQERYSLKILKLRKEGWKVFAEEDNIDSYETVLVKKIAIKEDYKDKPEADQFRKEQELQTEDKEEFPAQEETPFDKQMAIHHQEREDYRKNAVEKYKGIITDFHVKHGNEGPRHDPYSYSEYSFTMKGKKYVIHVGLAQYIKIDGQKVEATGDNYDHPEEFVLHYVGIPLEDIESQDPTHDPNHEEDPMGGLEESSRKYLKGFSDFTE